MFNFFCKILQHPKINPGSAPGYTSYTQTLTKDDENKSILKKLESFQHSMTLKLMSQLLHIKQINSLRK